MLEENNKEACPSKDEIYYMVLSLLLFMYLTSTHRTPISGSQTVPNEALRLGGIEVSQSAFSKESGTSFVEVFAPSACGLCPIGVPLPYGPERLSPRGSYIEADDFNG